MKKFNLKDLMKKLQDVMNFSFSLSPHTQNKAVPSVGYFSKQEFFKE